MSSKQSSSDIFGVGCQPQTNVWELLSEISGNYFDRGNRFGSNNDLHNRLQTYLDETSLLQTGSVRGGKRDG